MICGTRGRWVNTLRQRQNGCHFADNIFKCIFLNENVWIPIKISLKFVPKGPINNIPAMVQIMAWHRPGNKPLSEPMVVSLLTHICITRPQWVIYSQDPAVLHIYRIYLIFKLLWTKWPSFTDDTFRCPFVNEKFCILIKISLKFVPEGPTDNISALV